MFEEIALSISTVLFFLCTLVVGSVLPSAPAQTDTPTESVCYNSEEDTQIAVSASAISFSIVGEWDNAGKRFEFLNNGRMNYEGHSMKYSISGDTVIVEAEIDGQQRVFTLKCEQVSDRVMKLNGVTFYKIK